MRGAAYLSGLPDAMVVDVGGTTTDVGQIKSGFPREANSVVKVGGVRTLFRMPDLFSIGLGGGSHVSLDPVEGRAVVGRLPPDRRTRSPSAARSSPRRDIGVAAGLLEIGDRAKVAHLDAATCRAVLRARRDAWSRRASTG